MSKPYTAHDLRMVTRRLADIFSTPDNERDSLPELVTTQFADEIAPLARVFYAAEDQLHRKWAGAVLAAVPQSAWVDGPCGLLRVSPEGASMRFLSAASPQSDKQARSEYLAARQSLHENLLEWMPGPKRLHYRPMLTWHDLQHTPTPLAGDTEFGWLLAEIERMFEREVQEQIPDWREQTGTPATVAVPPDQKRAFAINAMRKLGPRIEHWCAQQQDLDHVPDSLLARVSANVSCNRILLEIAAQDERGREAEEMCATFLEALNERGISEVPRELKELPSQIRVDAFKSQDSEAPPELVLLNTCEVNEALREMLRNGFAFGGKLIGGEGTPFSRHMTATDIEKTVEWARELQQSYLNTRGSYGGPKMAAAAHGHTRHLFIFVMVLVAAFYSHAETEHAFKTETLKNLRHAIFPGRQVTAKGLTVHAKDALMKAYGLIYFSNDGWELRADRLRDYAQGTQYTRAALQLTMNFAVKARSSRALLALFRQLQEQRTNAEEAEEAEEDDQAAENS